MAILIINRSHYSQSPYNVLLRPLSRQPILLLTEFRKGFEGKHDVVEQIANFRRNGNVELRALELAEIHPITHLVATAETDLVRAARLRERLGVEGQSVVSAIAFRDKVVMKETASEAVEVPACRRIHSVMDIDQFINTNGYPVVIKPAAGAGSLNTFVIRERADLVELLDRDELEGYEIEEFIAGEMYTVDGLYYAGRFVVSWASRYVKDCLAFQRGEQASQVQLGDSHPLVERLHDFVARLFKVMPMPVLATFHAEVFHTPDDRLVLCEVASRTGGGGINNLGWHRFGINMHHEWIKAQCGILDKILKFRMKPAPDLFGFVQIPPRPGKLLEMPSHVPFTWVAEYLPEEVVGKRFHGLTESSDKIATILVRGLSEDEVVLRMETVTQWMTESCQWASDERP